MLFNRHLHLADRHSFLSPSKPSWLNYDDDKLDRVFYASEQARRGTRLHAVASELISLGERLPRTERTLNMYVNDAIGYRLTPEQPLYYSENCFGTADACGFRNNKLRISDLKTGVLEATMKQLEIYAALFCLEYRFRPFDIEMELRIYQNDAVKMQIPDPDDIFHIMEIIKLHDKRIELLKEVTS